MEASKSFEERLKEYKANTLTEQDIVKAARLVLAAQDLKDENGVYKPNVNIKDYEDLFPDISITKKLLEAYKNADVGYGDMKFEVDPTKYPLIADEDGYYKVPVKIEMPSFIKGNKEAEERWNEIFSITGDLSLPISFTPRPMDDVVLLKPPFIDFDQVQQVYPTMYNPSFSFEEHENPFLNRYIGRGFAEQMAWFDDSAFLDYNCWFIRERINLIKTRRTKHGKRKLIPYKASKILFKNVKPVSVATRTNDDEDVMERGGPLNWTLDVNFSYSN